MDNMTKLNYVFVHGGNINTDTWNSFSKNKVQTENGLMGGMVWDAIVSPLKAMGFRCFAPTLKDENISDLTDHINQIKCIIEDNDLYKVVLVAHSYGGMITTVLASIIPERIDSIVYIDAALPGPDQSLYDLLLDSGADPNSFIGLEPARAYVEKIKFNPNMIKNIKKVYIRCTKSIFTSVTEAAKNKIMSDKDGWSYFELPSSHIPMAEMPERLLQIIIQK